MYRECTYSILTLVTAFCGGSHYHNPNDNITQHNNLYFIL